MVTDRDIYASAKLLINQHGIKAEDVAMEKMLYFVHRDDVKGAGVWLKIMDAINNLESRKTQKYIQ